MRQTVVKTKARDPELKREIGIWLKEMREKAGLSQRDLARIVGFHYYTFVSQLENGRGRIPADKFSLWADALGIDRQVFVKKLMQHYDPIAFDILFPSNS